MLTLIEGGFTSTLHSEVIAEVKRATERGSRVYLIVPEQQTVNAECEMSEILPPTAPLFFEVTNFTRFTNTAFRQIGGISGEYCTPATKSLIMWRTLTELSEELSMTRGRKNIAPGVVTKALSATAELQSLGVMPDMLEEIKESVKGEGRLYEKLSDIGKIYSLYDSLTREKYTDAASDAIALADMLARDASFLSGCEIIIDGFTSFTEPQYKLIGEMMKHAPVTVSLLLDRTLEGAFEYSEIMGARARLIRLADEVGIEKQRKKSMRHDPERPEIIGEVCELLWRTEGTLDEESAKKLDEGGGRVRLFATPTIYEECDLVATDIKKRVIDGAKYSDFAIIARDVKPYFGVLDVALDAAGVPYFLSHPTDVGATPLVKLISCAYSTVIDGYRRESVITYLKCGLSELSVDERDELELYIEKWNIDRHRLVGGEWKMNPRGYEKMTDEDRERLARINAARERVMAPLIALAEGARQAKTVKEHAEVLLEFLKSISVTARLTERATRLIALGDTKGADEAMRLWGVLCDALDVLVDILGDVEANAESFLGQLTVALSGAKVGHIPAFVDVVTIGSADMIRLDDKKHVYLVGVNAGVFPASVGEGSFFTERDKAKLSALGVPIEPDLVLKNARELYSFSRAFAAGRESVTISYPEKTPMLAPINPSEVIGRISEITLGRVSPIKSTTIPKKDMIFTPVGALNLYGSLDDEQKEEIKLALYKSGLGERIAVLDGDIKNSALELGKEALGMLYRGELYLSQSKIDKFLSCPMAYFCRYNLHLGEEGEAEINSLVIGNFVHGVVERFFLEARRLGRSVGDLNDEERGGLTARCAEEYVAAILGENALSPRTRVTISRLERATRPVVDGLCEEFRGAKYEPRFFELELKRGDSSLPTPLILKGEGGERIVIGGKIDRVDTLKHGKDVYVRVIDYKTGKIDFLPSKLNEGEYLQMFIYLRALTEAKTSGFLESLGVEEGGRVIPGGVIYVRTAMKDAVVKDEGELKEKLHEMHSRDGMVLDDEVSLAAMNPEFMPPTPSARAKRFEERHYTPEVWQEISDTIEDIVKGVATRMRCGDIKTTPASRDGKSCNWCEYRSICRSAKLSETSW